MAARRYAQDTTVSTGQSQGEVKDLLKRAGSTQIAIYEDVEKTSVAFRMHERLYRITVPVKAKATNPAQEERRAWRLVLLLIKAKLEAVKEGASTIEREFLADMVTPDGRTVAEWTAEPLALAYKSGKMPKTLLLLGAPDA
jgi:hypothetical protein